MPLELEGAKLPLYKVAVYALLTPRERYSVVKEKYSLAIGNRQDRSKVPNSCCAMSNSGHLELEHQSVKCCVPLHYIIYY